MNPTRVIPGIGYPDGDAGWHGFRDNTGIFILPP